jgi:hypothetical protein
MLQQEKGELLFLPGSIKSVTIYGFHTMRRILKSIVKKPASSVVLVLKVKEHVAQLKPGGVKKSKNTEHLP